MKSWSIPLGCLSLLSISALAQQPSADVRQACHADFQKFCAGVKPGGAAEKGGLRRGDILVRLGLHEIGNVEDLMFALNASKPGETVTAVVKREGHEVRMSVTFTEGRRPK